jgi:hypothetical protein
MSDIYSIMLEESRQSFFQLENLMSYLDMKAFGLCAINALLFSIFAYLLSLFKAHIPLVMYIPSGLLVVSLIFLIFCTWPQDWNRQDGLATLNKYGTWDCERASRQLAKNYATSENELFIKYWEKFEHFRKGLILTIFAFVSGIFIFLLSYP